MRAWFRSPIRSGVVALAFLIAGTLVVPPSASASYSGLYVFGDSLADGGDGLLYNLADPGLGAVLGYRVPNTPNNPPYPPDATKFTNPGGLVAVEVLANALGLPLTPSFQGGNNFAIGGATTGLPNFAYEIAVVPNPPPNPSLPPGARFYPGLRDAGVAWELAQFQTRLGGGSADPDALYVIWAGPNDIFLNGAVPQPLSVPDLLAQMVGNIAGAVTQLYALGARDFLVPNMPDLGKTPEFNDPGDNPVEAAGLSFITDTFNKALAGALGQLEFGLAGADLILFDTNALFLDVLARPGDFGLTNTVDRCYVTAGCDPNTFMFWDGVHPTAATHRILAQGFLAAVPEPGALVLVLFALALLGARLRERGDTPRGCGRIPAAAAGVV